MRIRYRIHGAHVHCRVFYRGLAGELVFAETEWAEARAAFERIADVLPEEEPDIHGRRCTPDAVHTFTRSYPPKD